ncbi:hypothetical protein ACFL3H_00715 [Gemmatimonadota bacterium]
MSMKSVRIAILAILVMTTLPGCSKGPVDPDLSVTSFNYAAFAKDGSQLLAGIVLLSAADADSVMGQWNIDWVEGADHNYEVGTQIGHGDLRGTLVGNRLEIDLNPDWADSNVLLRGTWEGKRINGTWIYIGIAGPLSDGRFTLRPR